MKQNCNNFIILVLIFCSINVFGQEASITGVVQSDGKTIGFANIELEGTDYKTQTSSEGYYKLENVSPGTYNLKVSDVSFKTFYKEINLKENENLELNIELSNPEGEIALDDVVITGTMKAVTKLESPVPVEVYNKKYFMKNPTPNLFDAMQNVNGVRPQVNCNVCNTGDIHINGLEGPYTMVLIDGMPIVSSLGSVYGLSGIPSALIQRIEVVKGPASSLYGSEAIGGLINIITTNPSVSDKLSIDLMATNWQEYNVDLGYTFKAGNTADVLTGVNYYNYQNPIDNNGDNFTDVTLQDRISIFQKWNFNRKDNKLFSLVGRYMYEDRWGGDMRFNSSYRGGDEIYGESIYTSRAELIGNYQLPIDEKMFFSFSYTHHDQDSRYGTTSYIAKQKIAFGQLTWDKKIGNHDLLGGLALRYTYYDDNTPATKNLDSTNEPENTWLPGVFVQDEIRLADKHRLLLGLRFDNNNIHGEIFTPRLAYKWTLGNHNVFRLNAGTGFRVVNLFTEDHAALTGARKVDILEDLKPEKSYNVNLNYVKKIGFDSGAILSFDGSAFYTYFNNRIVPDYDTDITKIIYDNLDGYAESKGLSLNVDLRFKNGLNFILGGTLMENTITEDGVTTEPEFSENFMGTWTASYKFRKINLAIDYTGNVYSPMNLPTLIGKNDERMTESPWWSIQNIQLTYDGLNDFEIYGGVKNLLDWTPNEGNPYLITRTWDPFDKNIDENDPNDLPFDPAYVFAPNQGIRGFLGIRYKIR